MSIGSISWDYTFEQRIMNHMQEHDKPITTLAIQTDLKNNPWNSSPKHLKSMVQRNQKNLAIRSPSFDFSRDMDVLHSKTFYNSGSGPAKMLKELLEACHQISLAIHFALPNPNTQNTSIESLELSPLEYVSSTSLILAWKIDLVLICRQYTSGKSTDEEFEGVVENILPGVEKLEESRDKLRKEFEESLRMEGVDYRVPKEFWGSIEERCCVIEEAFKRI